MARKEYEVGGKRFLIEEGEQPADAVECKPVEVKAKTPANKARSVSNK